jgi:HSP20 family protein
MALVRWNPMKEIEDMQRRFDNLFSSTMGPMGAVGSMGALPGPQPLGLWGSEKLSESDWTPAVDVAETNEGYLLNAELPDVKKEDVKLAVQDGVLTLSGERRAEKEEKGKRYFRVERSYGRFERSFTLPTAVDENKITASFQNGILHVIVPKTSPGSVSGREIRIA